MASDYIVPQVVNYLHWKAEKKKVPLSGTFDLSPLCNMDCRMCYVRMTKEEMEATGGRPCTVAEWVALAKEAQEKGMLLLLLTGGEPFLWPGFQELYAELKKLGLVISINSNGTLINEETVRWLKEDPPTRINVTLYGASDETYARLCGNPHGFTQTTNAIRLLREAGISVKLNCSVTPYNTMDVPEIIAYAREHKLQIQSSAYMFPPMRRNEAMVGANDRFSAEEAAAQQARLAYLQHGEKWFGGHVRALEAGEGSMPFGEEECQDEGEPMHCRAGKTAFWVTWDGRMLPCGMINSPVAYPFETGFTAAWDYIMEESSKIRLPVSCASCQSKKQCNTCAAMVMTETGAFSRKPEYRCRMHGAYLPACKTYLETAGKRNGRI
ncbi:MAG: radical SAM protein [Clostridiales bacterium]|nr:radical SAM protein [Clostridiales bacterium]